MTNNNLYDVAVIGGGHNGLVCACYFSEARLKFNDVLWMKK